MIEEEMKDQARWEKERDPKQKIYVVTGIEVGYGADNEPLLKDVKIVKELPFDYFKQKVISSKRLRRAVNDR